MKIPIIEKPILIICASDTLVKLLTPIGKHLNFLGIEIRYATLTYSREKAELLLGSLISHEKYVGVVRLNKNWLSNFSGFIIGNDWGDEIKGIINLGKQLNVPSICIQESVIDFSGKKNRLRNANYALVQGAVTKSILTEYDNIFVTGNPRYDEIQYSPSIKNNIAFINVNFTYGVEERNRHKWIINVLESCNKSNLTPLLVQHPRDSADLSKYGVNHIRSNATIVHGLIRDSQVIITRFSSLIHEAICEGRPVCYFDPFNEKIFYDFNPDNVVLFKSADQSELEKSLIKIRNSDLEHSDFKNHIEPHLHDTGNAAKNCANKILEIIQLHTPSPKVSILLFYYYIIRAASKDIYRLITNKF